MMFPEKLSMSSSIIVMPKCNGCNRAIMPKDKCVKFNCPDCDDGDLIWRCESCREAARPYTCSKCNFTGP